MAPPLDISHHLLHFVFYNNTERSIRLTIAMHFKICMATNWVLEVTKNRQLEICQYVICIYTLWLKNWDATCNRIVMMNPIDMEGNDSLLVQSWHSLLWWSWLLSIQIRLAPCDLFFGRVQQEIILHKHQWPFLSSCTLWASHNFHIYRPCIWNTHNVTLQHSI